MTVVSPDRQVDLSLPGSVPLSDLIGQLLQLCTDHDDRSAPVVWTLRPLGGSTLALTSTLQSAQIRDGAVLELYPRSERTLPTRVEDVRDATEDAVDQTVGSWSRRDSTTAALLTLSGLAVVLLARPDLWAGSSGDGLPVAAGAAGALLWAAVRVARQDLLVAAHGLLAAGLAWAGALALTATTPSLVTSASLPAASRAALCAAAVLTAAAIVSWAVPRLAAWVAAAAVCLFATLGWAGMELIGRGPEQTVAFGCVVGVLGLGILPRASLAAGGLAGLDYLVRTRGRVDPAAVVTAFARSRSLLNGALLASAALTAAGAVWLAHAASPMEVALAAAVTCCLMLRARAFSQFLHVSALVLAGIGALLGQLISELTYDEPRLTTIPVLLLTALACVLLGRSGMSAPNDVAVARSRRLFDVAESLSVATLIPLLAGNLGVLDWVRGLVS